MQSTVQLYNLAKTWGKLGAALGQDAKSAEFHLFWSRLHRARSQNPHVCINPDLGIPNLLPGANSWPKGLQTLLTKLEYTRHEENEARKGGKRTFVRFTYKTRKKWSAMHGQWEEGLDRCKIIGVECAPPTRRADLGLREAVLDGRYGC